MPHFHSLFRNVCETFVVPTVAATWRRVCVVSTLNLPLPLFLLFQGYRFFFLQESSMSWICLCYKEIVRNLIFLNTLIQFISIYLFSSIVAFFLLFCKCNQLLFFSSLLSLFSFIFLMQFSLLHMTHALEFTYVCKSIAYLLLQNAT